MAKPVGWERGEEEEKKYLLKLRKRFFTSPCCQPREEGGKIAYLSPDSPTKWTEYEVTKKNNNLNRAGPLKMGGGSGRRSSQDFCWFENGFLLQSFCAREMISWRGFSLPPLLSFPLPFLDLLLLRGPPTPLRRRDFFSGASSSWLSSFCGNLDWGGRQQTPKKIFFAHVTTSILFLREATRWQSRIRGIRGAKAREEGGTSKKNLRVRFDAPFGTCCTFDFLSGKARN